MIPGAPQIDAESWILIDYNSGKVLTEQNADSRRDPASLTKMMTSYVIGQAMKAGKFKDSDLVTIGNDAGNRQPGVPWLFSDVPETGYASSGFTTHPWYQLAVW
jgi:D-alanyl-D-alanine carboxypeptidase